MFKTVLKHSAVYGVASQLPKIISIFTLPIITKYLTPFDYGVFGLITAYTAAISAFSSLGLKTRLSNTFFKHRNWYPYAWRQISGFLFFWNIPYGIVSAILIYLAIPKEAMHHVWEIIALNVGGILLFGRASLLGMSYYQYTQQPKKVVARTIIAALLSIGFNVYFIAVLKMGYMGWFWSTFLSGAITNGLYWYVVNYKLGFRPIYRFKKRYIKECLRVSLPTIPHYYSAYLLDVSDRVIMSFLKVPAVDIGRYNAAYTFGNYAKTFSTSTGLALGPVYQENYKANKFLLCRSIIFKLQTLFIVGGFVLALWMKEIMALLIKNKELAATYPLAIVIVMAYTFRPMYNGIGMAVIYHEKNKKLWRYTFTAGVVNVVLNLALIPLWGFKIAVVSTFVGNMIMGFSMYFSKEFRSLLKVNYFPALWFLVIVISCLIAFFLKDANAFTKAGFSIPLLLLVLVTFLNQKVKNIALTQYKKHFNKSKLKKNWN